MRLSWVFVLCIFCCHIPSATYAQHLPAVQYTPKEGLAHSNCLKAYQDSRGRMHFMTSDGLSVYDGVRFVNYTVADGLSHRMINDVIEIRPDSFLVATNTERINTLVNGRIGVFKTDNNPVPLVNAFHKSADGTIYALGDYGFYRLERNHFTKIPLTDSNGKPVDSNLHAVLETSQFMLLSTWSNLNPQRLILVNMRSMKAVDMLEDAYISIARDPASGTIWVSTSRGIFQVDNAHLLKGRLSLEKASVGHSLKPFSHASFHFDIKGSLWLYNRQELFRIKPGKQSTPEPILKTDQPINIASLFSDREGTLWVLTRGSGVYKMYFSRIQTFQENEKGDPLMAIGLSPGPGQRGIAYVDRSSGNLYIQRKESLWSFPLPYSIEINDLFIQDERIVISGTHSIIFIPKTGRTYNSTLARKIFEDSLVRFLHGKEDPFGNIIIPYFKNGKYQLSVIAGDHVFMDQPTHAAGKTQLIDRISFDTLKRLWIINRDNELLGYALKPGNPQKYFDLTVRYREELRPGGFRSIAIDKNNHIWIGTRDSGIYVFEPGSTGMATIRHIDKSQGLTDNFITDLATDGNDRIWASSTSGLDLIKVSASGPAIENITANSRIYQEIHRVVTDGMGGAWGLCAQGALIGVSGENETPYVPEPSLYISSIRAGNKKIEMPVGHLEFTYAENNIVVLVAAPSFIDEGTIQYSYLLEGSGQKYWSEPSTMPQFNFMNLAAGKYKLKVRSSFPAKRFPEKVTEISFDISPPYWQTSWFKTFTLALFAAVLLAIFSFYHKQLMIRERMALEKKQAIEKERTRIATDMHDDLGSWLSRIKYLSENMLLDKQSDPKIRTNLQKISSYSDEMVEKMGEIVWALNEKNDTLADLLAFSRSYAAEYLTSNNIECHFSAPGEVPNLFVKGELRRNVFLSLKEILYNVVKHANATTVNIAVTLSTELQIEILDNGRGIDFEHIRKYSNGLSNIRQRIEQSGGKVSFENRKGTLVTLSVPLDA